MATEALDVNKTLSFGKERYLVRQIRLVVPLGLLGAFMLWTTLGEGRTKTGTIITAIALVAGAITYIAYALWRRGNPGKPLLVLSSRGILKERGNRDPVLIPWDEIGGVDQIDVSYVNRGITIWERDVTAVRISQQFYRSRIHVDGWFQPGRGSTYDYIPKDGAIEVALHHDILSVPGPELRAAVEARWRAFSRHPNAKRPPAPAVPRPPRWKPTTVQTWAAGAVLAVLASALVWNWSWIYAPYSFSVPEGPGNHYIEEQLAKRGVSARLSDGRMTVVWHWDVARIGTTQCRKDIFRDPDALTLLPTYSVSARCLTQLTLKSGATATAPTKLVVETYDVEYALGKFRKGSAIVSAALGRDEAEQLLRGLEADGLR